MEREATTAPAAARGDRSARRLPGSLQQGLSNPGETYQDAEGELAELGRRLLEEKLRENHTLHIFTHSSIPCRETDEAEGAGARQQLTMASSGLVLKGCRMHAHARLCGAWMAPARE